MDEKDLVLTTQEVERVRREYAERYGDKEPVYAQVHVRFKGESDGDYDSFAKLNTEVKDEYEDEHVFFSFNGMDEFVRVATNYDNGEDFIITDLFLFCDEID